MRRAILTAILAATPLSAQTLEEKAAQLQNEAPANAALGLPAYDWWNEGLHGLARNGEATVFPQAIGLAATWDTALVERIGDVVATEARAKWNARPRGHAAGLFEGLTIWSPNINIFRDPRWGRGQETYGEDPYLTGRLAVAFVRGLQGPDPAHPKTIATPKHLAVHSGPEAGRDGFSVNVSPHDLEATYLPAFRTVVTEGKPLSLMCAYNAIHGTPVCADRALMVDRLRGDWGFAGLTVSDCDAVANIYLFHFAQPDAAHAAAAAIKGGTDLNCGSTYRALPQAVRLGLVDEAVVDAALARALATRRALGIVAGTRSPWDRIRAGAVGSAAHRALAVEAAEKAIVLLENRAATLPLAGKRIAVIGANADDLSVIEANYHGTAIRPVTPLEGLRQRFGTVAYAQGSLLAEGAPVVVPETALRSGTAAGLAAEVRDAAGKIVRRGIDRRIDLNVTKAAPFTASWSGEFVPPGPGRYRLAIDGPACWHRCSAHDRVTLWIGGEKRIDGAIGDVMETEIDAAGPVPIRLDFDHKGDDEGLRLRWIAPEAVQQAEALAAAARSDVVVAIVGLSPDLEGEALKVAVPGFAGGDRTEVTLPAPQRRLLAALAATDKPLVVVIASGSAVSLGDLTPAAVLQLWYPGVEGGTALARVLAGDVNPSGRLPVTIYHSSADLPAFVDYGMKERTYRYFTGTPAWRFGRGLSYTRFAYAPAVPAPAGIAAGQSLSITVPVRNDGERAGDEVVQAYLLPPDAGQVGTMTDAVLQRQLVGFQRVTLRPGETQSLRFTIDPRAMSSVDRAGVRRVLPGGYRLWIGGGQPGDAPGTWTRFAVTGPALDLPK
ncbi:glycoside hydrolase family 3 C-terminal domain-containing protein [Sphingomonas sp. KR1UV-12]|uniref:Glycoside hydrolase family 3 C-terminal domain-containing protein n=1 Tax=Sphingomonas aurea TaxID=3063994 RepID=A0ABT9EKZ9_9SPHN|nr:glycoside hydrolase family 3 C-terminal domain-containing protein [Sphingomonas sp. KR1UV-12]MDP1027648.1 glycoside hydrolase family 3 C-terminal domain-containing protein [Sphingomonas sp. KR1UV-12]